MREVTVTLSRHAVTFRWGAGTGVWMQRAEGSESVAYDADNVDCCWFCLATVDYDYSFFDEVLRYYEGRRQKTRTNRPETVLFIVALQFTEANSQYAKTEN